MSSSDSKLEIWESEEGGSLVLVRDRKYVVNGDWYLKPSDKYPGRLYRESSRGLAYYYIRVMNAPKGRGFNEIIERARKLM